MAKFKEGDVVILNLDADAYTNAPAGLRKRDECRMVVASVHQIKGKSTQIYYELQTLRSAAGIPYAVLEKWLTLTNQKE